MKRILFGFLGFLLLTVGLIIEALIVSGIFAAFINGWVLLVIAIIIFSIVVGEVIYKYGFKYKDYTTNKTDINL